MHWLNGQEDVAQGDGGQGTSLLPWAVDHPIPRFPVKLSLPVCR